jgi:hypothetical protein
MRVCEHPLAAVQYPQDHPRLFRSKLLVVFGSLAAQEGSRAASPCRATADGSVAEVLVRC